jgi:hypothetical protein
VVFRSSGIRSVAKYTFIIILTAAVSTVALWSFHVMPGTAGSTGAAASEEQEFTACLRNTMDIVKLTDINIDAYERIWRLCGNQIYNNLFFEDFIIRRDKFITQELDERVNLWMVVFITISGVVLAGIQLFMSFQLTRAGRSEFVKDTSLLAEHGKISLQSSVTGVLILTISLAFFVIYVKWIYNITEFHIERPDNLTSTQPQMLTDGKLGLPTSPSPQPPSPAPPPTKPN